MRPIWRQPYGSGDDELWLGVPTWANPKDELSIKYAYRRNGRLPRTAPEIPERVVTPMLLMLGKHGRLTPEELEQIEAMVNHLRGRKT